MGNVMGNIFGQTAGSLVSGSNNQQSAGHPVINWNPNEAPLYGKDDSKGWKDNVDYQALINDAVKNNNYAQAAILEQQRNAKIDALGLGVEKTGIRMKRRCTARMTAKAGRITLIIRHSSMMPSKTTIMRRLLS